jgi:hypothetical protein
MVLLQAGAAIVWFEFGTLQREGGSLRHSRVTGSRTVLLSYPSHHSFLKGLSVFCILCSCIALIPAETVDAFAVNQLISSDPSSHRRCHSLPVQSLSLSGTNMIASGAQDGQV